MRALWTLFKVIIALAIVVPLGIIGVSLAIGLLGAVVALAFLVLKVGLLGLCAYGAFRLVAGMLGRGSRKPAPVSLPLLQPVDPYYESAMRELERDMGQRPD